MWLVALETPERCVLADVSLLYFCVGGFVMVYAPRNEAEVESVLQIVKAAAWFVSGGDGIKDFCDERRDSGYVSAEEEDAES